MVHRTFLVGVNDLRIPAALQELPRWEDEDKIESLSDFGRRAEAAQCTVSVPPSPRRSDVIASVEERSGSCPQRSLLPAGNTYPNILCAPLAERG